MHISEVDLADGETYTDCPKCESETAIYCYWEQVECGSVNPYSTTRCAACGFFEGDRMYELFWEGGER